MNCATKKLFLFCVVFLIQGCASIVDEVVRDYYGVYDSIQIGDSKEDVLTLLRPGQSKLKLSQTKPEMRYTKRGDLYDVYFARSGRVPDGWTTDDEFTPYVFKNGTLVEIGWNFLGGPKRTSAEVAREQAQIQRASAGATKIDKDIRIEKHIHK